MVYVAVSAVSRVPLKRGPAGMVVVQGGSAGGAA